MFGLTFSILSQKPLLKPELTNVEEPEQRKVRSILERGEMQKLEHSPEFHPCRLVFAAKLDNGSDQRGKSDPSRTGCALQPLPWEVEPRSLFIEPAYGTISGQLVTSEIIMASESGCPIEYHRIDVDKCDPVFDKECQGNKYIPFRRADYDRQTGHSPNSPREQVISCFTRFYLFTRFIHW